MPKKEATEKDPCLLYSSLNEGHSPVAKTLWLASPGGPEPGLCHRLLGDIPSAQLPGQVLFSYLALFF